MRSISDKNAERSDGPGATPRCTRSRGLWRKLAGAAAIATAVAVLMVFAMPGTMVRFALNPLLAELRADGIAHAASRRTPAPSALPPGVSEADAFANAAVARWKADPGAPAIDAPLGRQRIDTTQRAVAFTFDDGPNGSGIPTARTLVSKGAKGTFFEVGSHLSTSPEHLAEVEYLVRTGMEIGSHGWVHDSNATTGAARMETLDPMLVRQQFSLMDRAFLEATGSRPYWLRPMAYRIGYPCLSLARADDYHVTGKAISVGDGNPAITADRVLANFKRSLDQSERQGGAGGAGGTVFCFHPAAKGTTAALARMIDYAQARGYRVVTLSELAGMDGSQGAQATTSASSRHMPLR